MDKNKTSLNQEDDESGEQGGQSGHIEFRDFLSTGASRDDLLSAQDLKHILIMHREAHEARVEKQKEKREVYDDLKAGKIPLQDFRQAKSASEAPLSHPVLSGEAQFSGANADLNMTPDAGENKNDSANPEQRLAQQLAFNKRHAPEAPAPRATPQLKR